MAKTDKRNSDRRPGPAGTPATPAEPASTESQPSTSILSRWFPSRAARHAKALCRHVRKILNHQRDLLAPKDVDELEAAMRSVKAVSAGKPDRAAVEKQVEHLEKTANKWLKPYPNAAWRENVEVLLVALAVAMGIRTFFLQPFKIPTGSMQPTLFGVESVNLRDEPGVGIPTGLARVKAWFKGDSYIHIKAGRDGQVTSVTEPVRFLIFNIYQKIVFAGKTYSIWFPPDYGGQPLGKRADVQPGQFFRQGEDIVKLKVTAGDHLFVDRLSYNFTRPKRGDIVVFATKGIPEARRRSVYPPIPADQFYIKRLIGLGGETLSLHADHDLLKDGVSFAVGHLVINGRPLSSSTPHFENLYSYFGARAGTKTLTYHENEYFGHALMGELAPTRAFQVRTNHYFVMGDNTLNSSDSRYWGDFPATSVIGKAFFVYWPISDRFGCGQR